MPRLSIPRSERGEDEAVAVDTMPELERYVLHRLGMLDTELREAAWWQRQHGGRGGIGRDLNRFRTGQQLLAIRSSAAFCTASWARATSWVDRTAALAATPAVALKKSRRPTSLASPLSCLCSTSLLIR